MRSCASCNGRKSTRLRIIFSWEHSALLSQSSVADMCLRAAPCESAEHMRVKLDPNGKLTKRPESPSAESGAVQVYSAGGGEVTPDDYSVNTTQHRTSDGVPPARSRPAAQVRSGGRARKARKPLAIRYRQRRALGVVRLPSWRPLSQVAEPGGSDAALVRWLRGVHRIIVRRDLAASAL